MGNSGRSSRNLDCVRTGVPDLALGIRVNADGGIWAWMESLEVLENSEGVNRPRSAESLFALVSLRLKMDFQLVEKRLLVLLSESRRRSGSSFGGGSGGSANDDICERLDGSWRLLMTAGRLWPSQALARQDHRGGLGCRCEVRCGTSL